MSYDWDAEETDLRDPQDKEPLHLPREYQQGGKREAEGQEIFKRLVKRLRNSQGQEQSSESQIEQAGDVKDIKTGKEVEKEQKSEESETGTNKSDSDKESGGSEDKTHLTISIQCAYCGEILGIKKHLEEYPEHYIMVELVEKEGLNK